MVFINNYNYNYKLFLDNNNILQNKLLVCVD